MSRSFDDVQESYDRVAADYERKFTNELDHKPRDRQLLTTLAATTSGLVADIGSGPGHVAGYLRDRGTQVLGVDLSIEMAALAATRSIGGIAADMAQLPFADASLGGIVAFYSIIHIPRPAVGEVLTEFARCIGQGGRMLISAHAGEGELHTDEFLGHAVPFAATLFAHDELSRLVIEAGFDVTDSFERSSYPDEHPTRRIYVTGVRT
jgi:SAM-dependent methyltransferase